MSDLVTKRMTEHIVQLEADLVKCREEKGWALVGRDTLQIELNRFKRVINLLEAERDGAYKKRDQYLADRNASIEREERLEAESYGAKKQAGLSQIVTKQLSDRIDQQVDRITALEAGLKRHGRHRKECAIFKSKPAQNIWLKCDCGLTDLIG